MNDINKYPALKSLLAGSFYQCWEEFDGRPASEIVKEAVSSFSRSDSLKAIEELNEIFSHIESLVEFDRIIGRQIGCNYSPKYYGISDVEWLVELKQKLEKNSL